MVLLGGTLLVTCGPAAAVLAMLLGFVFEISLLVIETALLKLSGEPLIVFNVAFCVICIPVMLVAFRRMAALDA